MQELNEASEGLNSPGYLDEQIRAFLSISQEERNAKWQSSDFPALFPRLVKRTLSPQGFETFSSRDRREIFVSTLETFSILPWEGLPYWNDQDIRPIGTHSRVFTENGEILSTSTSSREEANADSLIRADVGSIILLGMSLDDEEQAMKEIIEFYQRSGSGRTTFRQNLGLLLVKESATRKWIKTNRLDVATGYEWDQQVAELILNLPENVIDPKKKLPRTGLPRELTYSFGLYSIEAINIFLDYALIYIQNLSLTTRRKTDQIQDFILQVRRLPEDFVLLPSTQAVLIQLRQAIIQAGYRSEPSQGKVPVARELLPNPPRILRIRWLNHEVRKLLS